MYSHKAIARQASNHPKGSVMPNSDRRELSRKICFAKYT